MPLVLDWIVGRPLGRTEGAVFAVAWAMEVAAQAAAETSVVCRPAAPSWEKVVVAGKGLVAEVAVRGDLAVAGIG